MAPHSSTLAGKPHGWRSLVGYSPWGRWESDTTSLSLSLSMTMWGLEKDFIQLPPSHEYNYVLVLVCMFLHWAEATSCRQATASSVTKVPLKKIITTWTTLELHSDQGTHLTSQVRQLCTVWPVSQHFDHTYHCQPSSLVKCTNDIVKIQTGNL